MTWQSGAWIPAGYRAPTAENITRPALLAAAMTAFMSGPGRARPGPGGAVDATRAGDAIQYLMDFCGKTFKEAAAAIGRDLQDLPPGADHSRQRKKPTFTPAEHKPPADQWRVKASAFVDWATSS